MSYQYDATAAERKAEALLRTKGWSVSEPACPLCHGFGAVFDQASAFSESELTITTTVTSAPCPNGCDVNWSYTHSGTLPNFPTLTAGTG